MKRSEIKEEDKWDLTKYFKSTKEYNDLYKETKKLIEEITKMENKIVSSSTSLYEYLELDLKANYNLEKIYTYSYLYHYSDMSNIEGLKLKDKADKLLEFCNEKTSFTNSELLSAPYSKIKEYLKENKNLEKYAFYLEKIFRYEEHTLSKEEEKIISMASNTFGTPDNVFSALDNSDAKFPTIIVNHKEIEINHSNYAELMNNKDRKVREETFKKYYSFYINHENTIAENYKGQIKEDLFMSKVRKFNSPLEMSLYNDNIPVKVYKNLIKTIHENLKPMYEYMELRKEFLGYKDLHMYDIYVDLTTNKLQKFTFDEGKDIVLNALKPLGDTYIKDLSKAFTDRWIDKFPNDNKRSGAYQWGSYGVTPFVSLNFSGIEDSVSTTAHELGHAMHSYYSDKNQEYQYAQYPIFLAEIASTVNEVLVNEYMINNAKSDSEKFLYITSFLDKYRATVYRQTMFAEFEMIIHDLERNGKSITKEVLASTYLELNKLYYGKNVISDDEIKYEWSRIPHFYTPFYVYKYATGFTAALAIASDILNNKENAKENYLEFLSSGGSKYPLEILKKCHVDMTKEEPIIKGIKMFEDKLKMAKKLAKKVK